MHQSETVLTYSDEDFMSIMKKMGEASAHGTPAHKLVWKLGQRYARAMAYACTDDV